MELVCTLEEVAAHPLLAPLNITASFDSCTARTAQHGQCPQTQPPTLPCGTGGAGLAVALRAHSSMEYRAAPWQGRGHWSRGQGKAASQPPASF